MRSRTPAERSFVDEAFACFPMLDAPLPGRSAKQSVSGSGAVFGARLAVLICGP